MTADEKIQAILTAAAAVTALVPADRIKAPGDWQNLTAPYIVHFPVAVEPTHCHDGPKDLNIWRFYQVSVFATKHSEARAIANAVRTALDGYYDADVDRIAFKALISLGYDTDRKLSHIALDFEAAGSLT